MDIMIFGNMDEAGDEALRKVCEDKSNIVSGSYINYSTAFAVNEKGEPYIDYFHIDSISEPIIADVCHTGFVNAATDEDGILRSAFMTQSSPDINGGKGFKSFSSEIYSLYCEKKGLSEYIPELDGNGRFWINYAGRPGDYEHISFIDVLNGNVDPRIFTDCIVLIGAYAAGMQDQYSVPGSSSQMYGVEIHANILQGLMDEKSPVPAGRWHASAVSAAAAALARLEANAKRGQVLISEYVYEQVKDRVEVEPIGEIPLKGKSKGVFVYSLKNIIEDSAAKESAQPAVPETVQ